MLNTLKYLRFFRRKKWMVKSAIVKSWVRFSSKNFCKSFQDFPSHRIFGRMHETLNVDKK
jgi:hypothetical protein